LGAVEVVERGEGLNRIFLRSFLFYFFCFWCLFFSDEQGRGCGGGGGGFGVAHGAEQQRFTESFSMSSG
jgi:hypothetical protein